ncbi:hypothetical protein IC235_11165 [Hymenobacter sp. BT664]|uniref:Uncharacterized protein n=1 Tax=Hymenobacter montanus TaxID=2771359 RepID=A0A927BE67_9BACT|nr:hypothetical protein [Hymenobacter montanus]MBD2768449.1 hypothetical protein [Hymenobacter montanus]
MLTREESIIKKIQEFKDAVHESQFDECLEYLIKKAYEKPVLILLENRNGLGSEIDKSSTIRIDNSFECKRIIIYELMHEIGHLLDPIKRDCSITDINSKDPGSVCSREIRAWEAADSEFDRFPELKEHKQEYQKHKAHCKHTYGIEGQ